MDQWFNVNAGIVKLGGQQPANNIRTFPTRFGGIRASSSNAWNSSVIKNFRVTNRLKAQFRFEFYNILNHTEFAAPNVTTTSTVFGQITSTIANANTRWAILEFQAFF